MPGQQGQTTKFTASAAVEHVRGEHLLVDAQDSTSSMHSDALRHEFGAAGPSARDADPQHFFSSPPRLPHATSRNTVGEGSQPSGQDASSSSTALGYVSAPPRTQDEHNDPRPSTASEFNLLPVLSTPIPTSFRAPPSPHRAVPLEQTMRETQEVVDINETERNSEMAPR